MTYFSPSVVRNGNCCGTTNPDRCVSFSVTLHPEAIGIIFDICDGAIPPGAMFYQVECGPATAVGNVLCLDGAGPHLITFCKPGNNTNIYCITSVPTPSAGPDQVASDGCNAQLQAIGYDPATLTWTSIAPGPTGQFNSTLSCLTCPNPIVTAPAVFPPFADYMVCGTPMGGCAQTPFCDTVRVHFAATLGVSIQPEFPVICIGSPGVDVQAIGSGGFPPYTITWSNGTVGDTDFISSGGNYSISISDSTGCPPATFPFSVFEYELPISISAGNDITICSDENLVLLNGSFAGNITPTWIGGTGNFVPNANHPQAVYQPTATELASGTLNLQYGIIPTDGCPPLLDDVTLTFGTFDTSANSALTDVTCAGLNNGSISLNLNGNQGPYTYVWSNSETTPSVSGLAVGAYSVQVTNIFGCVELFDFQINEPDPLDLFLMNSLDPLCFNQTNGFAEVDATGGTPPYVFEWSVPEITTTQGANLSAGDYGVTVTDANGCGDNLNFSLFEPQPLAMTLNDDMTVCPGEAFTLTASVSGGTLPYQYAWSNNLLGIPSHTLSMNASNTFSVSVSDANGCNVPVESVNITVITLDPTNLSTAGGGILCLGQQGFVAAQYTGDFGPYTFQWSGGLPSGAGPHTVSPSGTQSFVVTVSDICNNELSAAVDFTVSDPAANLVITAPLCFDSGDGTLNVNPSGGVAPYSIQWSIAGQTGASVQNVGPGSYAVTVIDAGGCIAQQNFQVIAPLPLSLQSSGDVVVCPNELFTITTSVTGGTGAYTYHWNNGFLNLPNQSLNLTQSDVIAVFATDANGCSSNVDSVLVTVLMLDPLLLSTYGQGDHCASTPFEIGAEYTGGPGPFSFQWNQGLPPTPGPHTVNPTQNTTYNVTLTDECGNFLQASIPVIIRPLPGINLPFMLGQGCAPLAVELIDSQNSGEGFSHQWSVPGLGNQSGNGITVNFPNPGVFDIGLTVTDPFGCVSTSDQNSFVEVWPSPVAAFTAFPPVVYADNPVVQFTNTSSSDVTEWTWLFQGTEIDNEANPSFSFEGLGFFAAMLTVTNAYGCSDIAERIIEVKPVYDVIIPNAFSPTPGGGNGFYDPNALNNDVFYPFADYVDQFRMSIYNRWGELVFESLDLHHGWDGQYRGEPAQMDVYAYKVEITFVDGYETVLTGNVTLFR